MPPAPPRRAGPPARWRSPEAARDEEHRENRRPPPDLAGRWRDRLGGTRYPATSGVGGLRARSVRLQDERRDGTPRLDHLHHVICVVVDPAHRCPPFGCGTPASLEGGSDIPCAAHV